MKGEEMRGVWGDEGALKEAANSRRIYLLSLALAVFGERSLEMAIVRRIALFLWASSGHDRKKGGSER
jgi:hypothetical protein